MKIKREFKNSYLIDELGLPFNGYNGCKVISNKIVDQSRWSIHHKLVFHFENKYYMTWYSIGATEQQDEMPWEDDDIVDCFEVEPVEKIVTVFLCKEVDDNE